MRNIIASILIILASFSMAIMGTVGTFGWFLIVPVTLSSTALALAITELFEPKRGDRKSGAVQVHAEGVNPGIPSRGRRHTLDTWRSVM